MTIFEFVKAVGIGSYSGIKWYGRRIRESKWYIIPLIIDIAFIPVKANCDSINVLNGKRT